MKTVAMDIAFELQHLEQISEFSEALFPSHLENGYRVKCVYTQWQLGSLW